MNTRIPMARTLTVVAIMLVAGCSQQFAVSINEQSVYDPRPNATAVRFADAGLQACVNIALQQPDATVENLTVLACPGWEITEIEGIDALGGLQFLDISDNRVSSVAPLEGLNALSSLTAANNRLTDIAPLLSMKTLTSATLTGNNDIPCGQLDALTVKLGENLRRSGTCKR